MIKSGWMAALGFAVAMSFGTASAQGVMSIDIGSPIPVENGTMKSADKQDISLKSISTANGLLVMFSCNTCPYVIKSQARTKEIMNYAKAKNIGMVIINSNDALRDGADSYEAMTRYAKREGYTVPYVLDEGAKLADAFGATRTPEVYLFNGEGKLVYKGAMEDNPSDPGNSTQMFLRVAMDNMLANKPIDPNTTKSIGCTIKRTM